MFSYKSFSSNSKTVQAHEPLFMWVKPKSPWVAEQPSFFHPAQVHGNMEEWVKGSVTTEVDHTCVFKTELEMMKRLRES